MGKVAFAEILDRRGNLRERVRVDAFPATVGRGYGNAVIVDDRFVSVEHLRLSLDDEGGMIVEDLNTANGTWLSKSRERIERYTVPVGGEALIRIGQTALRLRGSDFAVEPAAPPQPGFGSFARLIENRGISLLIFIATFGLYVFSFAQSISKKVIWSDLTGTSLVLLIAFVLWAGFWAFLSRLIIHSFRFMTHLAISAVFSVLFLVVTIAVQYFEFLFSAPEAANVADFAGFAVIFSLLLYGHLSVVSESPRLKRLLSSALISAAIVGIILLIRYTKNEEFTNEVRFSSVIKPIGRTWVRTVSSDAFFGDLGSLKAKIDATARKGVKATKDKTAGKK
jgi:hypothetical protein